MFTPDTKSVHYTLGVLIATLSGIKSNLALIEIHNTPFHATIESCNRYIKRAEEQIALYDSNRNDLMKLPTITLK